MQSFIGSISLTISGWLLLYGLINILIKGSFQYSWWDNKIVLSLGIILLGAALISSATRVIKIVVKKENEKIRRIITHLLFFSLGVPALILVFIDPLIKGPLVAQEPDIVILVWEIILVGSMTLFGLTSTVVEIFTWKT